MNCDSIYIVRYVRSPLPLGIRIIRQSSKCSYLILKSALETSGTLLGWRMIVILQAVCYISNSYCTSRSRWITDCCWECRYGSWVFQFEEREHGRFCMLERQSSDCVLFWKKLCWDWNFCEVYLNSLIKKDKFLHLWEESLCQKLSSVCSLVIA